MVTRASRLSVLSLALLSLPATYATTNWQAVYANISRCAF